MVIVNKLDRVALMVDPTQAVIATKIQFPANLLLAPS